MKRAHYFVTFLFVFGSTLAFAQKGTVDEQKACYEQAHKYVTDKNIGRKEYLWQLDYAHYSTNSRTCYVQMSGTALPYVQTTLVDAYEGKMLATCTSSISKPDEKIEDDPHATIGRCLVGDRATKTRREWDHVVSTLIQ